MEELQHQLIWIVSNVSVIHVLNGLSSIHQLWIIILNFDPLSDRVRGWRHARQPKDESDVSSESRGEERGSVNLYIIGHSFNVGYIYLHLQHHKIQPNVGKYTGPMDPTGFFSSDQFGEI